MGDYRFIESWDNYWNGQATPNGSQAVWVKGYLDQELVPGRYGGLCLQHTRAGGTEDIHCDLPDGSITTGQITIGFAWKVSNALSRTLMVLNQAGGTTAQFSIYQNADGSLSIRNGNGGTVLGTSAAALIAIDTWYYIEVSVAIDNSGTATLSLNGTEIINVSGVDTMGAANLNVGRITLPEPLTSGTMWYDDLYVRDDLTKAGPSVVLFRRPLTAIGGGDFNLTATSAYIFPLLVADQAAELTSYITGTTVTDEQFFDFEDLAKLTGTGLRAVSLVCFAKVDAGTGTLDPVVKSNGDETVGAAWALDTTFRFLRRIYSLDPDTGAAWTRSAFADSQGGVRIASLAGGATQVQISQMGYNCLLPISSFLVSGGHRYWSIVPLTWNGGSRPGAFMVGFTAPDGEYLQPRVASGDGGIWRGNDDFWRATDGRKDTRYIGANGPNYRLTLDYGGPVIAKTLYLGSQSALVNESFRTFRVDYSDDGSTWTTLYTESTPQTGWTSTESRTFVLPDITAPLARRRQTLILT